MMAGRRLGALAYERSMARRTWLFWVALLLYVVLL